MKWPFYRMTYNTDEILILILVHISNYRIRYILAYFDIPTYKLENAQLVIIWPFVEIHESKIFFYSRQCK